MYGTKRKICTIDAELFWRRRKYFQKNHKKPPVNKNQMFLNSLCICKVEVEIFFLTNIIVTEIAGN